MRWFGCLRNNAARCPACFRCFARRFENAGEHRDGEPSLLRPMIGARCEPRGARRISHATNWRLGRSGQGGVVHGAAGALMARRRSGRAMSAGEPSRRGAVQEVSLRFASLQLEPPWGACAQPSRSSSGCRIRNCRGFCPISHFGIRPRPDHVAPVCGFQYFGVIRRPRPCPRGRGFIMSRTSTPLSASNSSTRCARRCASRSLARSISFLRSSHCTNSSL
nr:hypothetical protein DO63_5873 [Burkholderia pseudomallei]